METKIYYTIYLVYNKKVNSNEDVILPTVCTSIYEAEKTKDSLINGEPIIVEVRLPIKLAGGYEVAQSREIINKSNEIL